MYFWQKKKKSLYYIHFMFYHFPSKLYLLQQCRLLHSAYFSQNPKNRLPKFGEHDFQTQAFKMILIRIIKFQCSILKVWTTCQTADVHFVSSTFYGHYSCIFYIPWITHYRTSQATTFHLTLHINIVTIHLKTGQLRYNSDCKRINQ